MELKYVTFITHQQIRDERWKPPDECCLKINFDTAFHEQAKKSCIWIVVRDRQSHVIGSQAVLNENIPLAFATKALACLYAVVWGWILDYRSRCLFGYVPQDENTVAYLLAKKGLRRGESVYLSGGVPNFALMAVERDRWALLVDGERGWGLDAWESPPTKFVGNDLLESERVDQPGLLVSVCFILVCGYVWTLWFCFGFAINE
ncbi:hypothetical protein Gotri_020806 [Gossypium trilobum]|uniref:Uncharacterized protein n=1 Tax=Gossypium trilobum TaxID=34281 RepID=A0A7J9DAV7_9ROSI|nr:hypothetical protein [Gossypium trilobum]